MKKKLKAYTLMEVIAVVVILGVLAVIAMPSFNIAIERMKAQEGVQLLKMLYQAQNEMRRDQAYAPPLNSCDNNECYGRGAFWASATFKNYAEIPTPVPPGYLKNFSIGTLNLGCGLDDSCPGSGCHCDFGVGNEMTCGGPVVGFLASIRRNVAATSPYYYTLYVLEDGEVVCKFAAAGPASCSGMCKKLGFRDGW